ncbi:4-amino-4-deoxy-L-arabinose-phospho-UDP flippase [Bordetella genomosp. 10]|uniref:4-amino-4-deoxy-L-arabinose-phospho-UDP flippase n=1 Tax=Bordetella genomosp. 10 TaxID=1416804 RepID=A0A261S5I6_9BORD|nr:EamA family transporter [Bordetella genomosp. 10]OZI32040.1 4-amino-4-deoxy-L-arabinose-phospho-UDP flippase [Bordetella genomosp. 10]
MNYFVAVLCVLGIAAGQILFKMCAQSLHRTGSFFVMETATTLFLALALYGITTIAWIWVLQKLDLGRVYPFMALAFVLVPIASHFIFNEQFKPQYFIGVGLIMVGIVVAVKA